MKKDLLSLLPEEREAEIVALGAPKYRSAQVGRWLSRGVRSFDEMSDLPKDLRDKLKDSFRIYKPKVLSKQVSALDGTIKYLWELSDGNAVETVVMSYQYGNTVCISSQVGCRQGCAFCASTIGGLVRCLEPSEMLDEVMFSEIDSGKKLSFAIYCKGIYFGRAKRMLNRELLLMCERNGIQIAMPQIVVNEAGEVHQDSENKTE